MPLVGLLAPAVGVENLLAPADREVQEPGSFHQVEELNKLERRLLSSVQVMGKGPMAAKGLQKAHAMQTHSPTMPSLPPSHQEGGSFSPFYIFSPLNFKGRNYKTESPHIPGDIYA